MNNRYPKSRPVSRPERNLNITPVTSEGGIFTIIVTKAKKSNIGSSWPLDRAVMITLFIIAQKFSFWVVVPRGAS
jgi:hypothetical protein